MNFSVQFGWQQIILLLVALLGIWLFISSLLGLIVRAKQVVEFEDEHGRTYRRWQRRRRQFRWQRGVSGIFCLVFALSLLWFLAAVQSYMSLTGEVKVAEIYATQVKNADHMMSIDLTLFDREGKVESRETYFLGGDRWVLQANIIEFHPWVNILGVQTSYKLTRLYGQYDDFEAHTIEPVALNGGDDEFFKSIRDGSAFTSPFVQSAYANAVILPADGKTYEIFVSRDAVKGRPLE